MRCRVAGPPNWTPRYRAGVQNHKRTPRLPVPLSTQLAHVLIITAALTFADQPAGVVQVDFAGGDSGDSVCRRLLEKATMEDWHRRDLG